MNLISALISRILELEDFNTWIKVRKHYLTSEFHNLYDSIQKHNDTYQKLPCLDELKLGIRDSKTLEKVYALEDISTDIDPDILLDYVVNEYTQRELLYQLDKYIDESLAFESAEEALTHLQELTTTVEDKIESHIHAENMQNIELFEDDEVIEGMVTLGLNEEFDKHIQWKNTDYIMIGGRRGSGKSILMSNIANHIVEDLDQSAVIFSTEMQVIEVLQRCCSISTGVPYGNLRRKDLNIADWKKIAKWWANRFENGNEHYDKYLTHNNFAEFHHELVKEKLGPNQLHIIYDPHLTLSKIRAESQKLHRELENLALIGVDYINKVHRFNREDDLLDWKNQIGVSGGLKGIFVDLECLGITPYQIDVTGEARFAKGILDDADASYIIDAHTKKDRCITLNCTKSRHGNDEATFSTAMDWDTLKMGPESMDEPRVEEEPKAGKALNKNAELPWESVE